MYESGFSMPSYFQNMEPMGDTLKRSNDENIEKLKEIEAGIAAEVKRIVNSGKSTEAINERGQWTAWQRIEYLVDEGTWCPLHSIFDPEANDEGTTAVVDGIGRINGRWAVIIASDNKQLAGAWIPGQAENILRVTDIAKRLNIPLVWVLNCSGVKLSHQEYVYANRRGGGTPFFRHAELAQAGIPVIVGIYGTNPAGGGYHSISPSVLIAHEKANMAVGGSGIVGGMNPKGYIDEEAAEQLIEATRGFKGNPPGSVEIHHGVTGFMREVADSEEGVLDIIKEYVASMPAYDPYFFKVDEPEEPMFPAEDLYSLVPLSPKKTYDIRDVLARIFDSSEHMEYKPDYGPEIYTGLAKIDGFLVGFVANTQGLLMNYPEYTDQYIGIGGKLYRQGLIKMSEFVTFCSRDRIPIVWVQDTSGIDVGNIAEQAELLGLGQSLIYSIQNSDIPQLEITLRKGSAAAHYVMGGPQGNKTNAFSLGTAATEMYVMHGETAAAAMYSRRLVKDKDAGKPLDGTIEKMNKIIKDYHEKSRPDYCAKVGFVDEVVNMTYLRNYIKAFVNSVYQNPKSFCPFHQMITPRIIRDYNNVNK
ncbi:carboxyl transferase domain-containing protein [Wukongibacter baidiensis]|uniref:acyl-CoA carboxylase subunit beta n=1 Tax=Wukongibacter baidiensis TaxID=1723361 RepID=UPI003D7FD9E9